MFLISDSQGRAKSMVGRAAPGLVVLGSVRKQAEQAMKSTPLNSTHPGPLDRFRPPDSCPHCSFSLLIYLFYLYQYTVALFRHAKKKKNHPVTDDCKPSCGHWELNSGPMEEHLNPLSHPPSLLLMMHCYMEL